MKKTTRQIYGSGTKSRAEDENSILGGGFWIESLRGEFRKKKTDDLKTFVK